MTRSSLCATWVGALAAASAALLFQSGGARAQYSQCESNEDCGPGFVCNEGTFESCSGGWTCDDEGNCTMEPSECTTYEQNWCSSATCATNDDCPSYMLCQPQTSYVCEGGMAGTGAGGAPGGAGGAGGAVSDGGAACGPDGGCDEPICYEVPAPSLCIQRHFLPCEVASDCGGGFDCVDSYYYECGGSDGGVAGAAGMVAAGAGGVSGSAGTGVGGEDAGSDYDCHQVPSGESYCSLQELPCESDAQCPAGLECKEYYEYMPCEFIPGEGGSGSGAVDGGAGTGGVGGTGGAAGTGMGGDDAGTGYEEPGTWVCPEPEVSNRCQPFSYGTGGSGGMGGVGGAAGSAGVGGSTGESDAGVAGTGAQDPGGGNGGTGAGEGGGEDDGESDEHGHGNGHGRGRGWLKKLLSGCSAGGPVDGDGSMGWLMLGLAAVVLRRRTRRA